MVFVQLAITAWKVQFYHHHVLLEPIIHILVKIILLTVLFVRKVLIVTWLVQILLDLNVRLDIIVQPAQQSKLKWNAQQAHIVHLVHLPLSYAL